MNTLRESWDSIPRFVRGTIVFGLGAVAASTFFLNRETAPNQVAARPQVSYAVGVICAHHTARVSYSADAYGYRFHCTLPDGTLDDVTEVQNLDVAAYEAGEITGFNKIVPITMTGQAIDFNFQGPDAIATIYQQYVNNSDYNDPTTGLARVSN